MSTSDTPSFTVEPGISTLVDAYGVHIRVYTWAAEQPHAIVQIAHGVGEHAMRYAAFANELVRAGFTVVANDHRGHGITGLQQWDGDERKLGKLGPGGLRAAEAAIALVTDEVRSIWTGLPVIMFGHSWGSLMTQRMLNRDPEQFDAVILSGSAYRTPGHLESGDLNRNWRAPDANGFEWLSRDPETQRAFLDDSLCFSANILKLFGLPDAMRLYGVPQRASAAVPLLIISGEADPLNRDHGLRKLADAYLAQGATDVAVRLYPGARHELLNETNRDSVIADVITWLWERFPPVGSEA